jgi:hypothetical protein
MTAQALKKVDHSALKVNQVIIITLNILAFVIDQWWLAAFVAAVMGLGSLLGVPGFILIYKNVLKPLGWVKPDVLDDNPEPHRFAQFVGFLFMAGGSALLFAGSAAGWVLVWIVAALAALNAFAGFCVGCAMYYWFARLKVPGFSRKPPINTFPGMKPKAEVDYEL